MVLLAYPQSNIIKNCFESAQYVDRLERINTHSGSIQESVNDEDIFRLEKCVVHDKDQMRAVTRSTVLFNSRLITREASLTIASPSPAGQFLNRAFSSQQRWHEQAPKLEKTGYLKHEQDTKQKKSSFGGRYIGVAAATGAAAFAYSYTQSSSPKIFDPPRFTPFTITHREQVSSTSIILTLRPQNISKHEGGTDPYASWWQSGTWSVEVKQPQLQIARAYTPLPPREGDIQNGDLRFLIRKERNGEVSGYLHALGVGEMVQMRGPRTELVLDNGLEEVLFLAGGTGIAPAMQVAHTLLEKRGEQASKPSVRIIWANRKREDCVGGATTTATAVVKPGQVVEQLMDMQRRHPDRLRVDYVVDDEKTFVDRKRLMQATQSGKVTAVPQAEASKLLIISGPDGFITHLAGKKLWDGGQGGQGQLGGVIDAIGLKGWRVWKM